MKNNINLFELLDQNLDINNLFCSYSSICFYSSSSSTFGSSLFFLEFFKKIDKNIITQLSVSGLSLNQLTQTLEISFLGQKLWYHLKDLHLLDNKYKSDFLKYLENYTGPHTVSFFHSTGKSHQINIEIPKFISLENYIILSQFLLRNALLNNKIIDKYFANLIFQEQVNIDLDQACLLLYYQQLLGRKTDSFFVDYFPALVKSESRFFTLSQYFFAKQPNNFFPILFKLEQTYPIEYWMVFWLEQLWQAIIFVELAQKSGPDIAKTFVTRLPFSFTQKDWKKYNIATLINMHQELYDLDYNLKSGASDLGLSIWYIKHFYN